MALSCGIVGLPNVGKSTLFNSLTKAGAAAANYPFCTIEPNVGVVCVPDHRLQALATIVKPERILPAVMSFVDIAGLVKGASTGEGLGNKFLSHIREVNAICHVVRCFHDDDVTHVDGNIDPIRDVETVETELILSDCSSVTKQLDKAKKVAKAQKDAKITVDFYENLLSHLDQGNLARSFEFDRKNDDFVNYYANLFLITAKKTVFIANVDENTVSGGANKYLDALNAYAKERGDIVVPVCAKIEAELAELSEEERSEYMKMMAIESTGLERIIKASFQILGLQTYLTAGVKEVRAWTMKEGTKAPQAAGIIHSDFEKGFIKADVIWWEDFVKYGGEAGCKNIGKQRLEGKEYIVKDGDVMHFKFNV